MMSNKDADETTPEHSQQTSELGLSKKELAELGLSCYHDVSDEMPASSASSMLRNKQCFEHVVSETVTESEMEMQTEADMMNRVKRARPCGDCPAGATAAAAAKAGVASAAAVAGLGVAVGKDDGRLFGDGVNFLCGTP